jgi:hypothetical protein
MIHASRLGPPAGHRHGDPWIPSTRTYCGIHPAGERIRGSLRMLREAVTCRRCRRSLAGKRPTAQIVISEGRL